MDLSFFLDMLVTKFPAALGGFMAAGTLITCGKAYIKASASKNDDAFLAKLEAKALVALALAGLEKFSLVKPKE